jgi:hypothetical protein
METDAARRLGSRTCGDSGDPQEMLSFLAFRVLGLGGKEIMDDQGRHLRWRRVDLEAT